MSQAVGLAIDANFLKQLEDADKAISKISSKTNNLAEVTVKAFKQMANQGVIPYVENLEQLKRIYSEIANAKLEKPTEDMTNMQDAARKAMNEVNALAMAIQKTDAYKKAISNQNLSNASNAGLYELKQISDQITMRQKGEELIARTEAERHKGRQKEYDEMGVRLDKEQKTIQEYASINQSQQEREAANKARWNRQAIEQTQREAREKRKMYEELFHLQAQQQSQARANKYQHIQGYGDTSNQAMAAYNRLYSGVGVMSINNMEVTLTKLRDAQDKINLSTKAGKRRYKELGDAIKQVEESLASARGESDNLMKSSNQLGNVLTAVFSLHTLQKFVNKMVKVYGTMEQQHKAMQVILQNKEDANKIWEQTMDLAVKSPFQISQLIDYTRQLAAYRIETEKLHDTTKMLADVSAGLGVDMRRLILAFGQVKAASFLRGTELRQFTEAGIPMLEELAKHFTELEGKVVSVDQVFGMISRRQVEFKDVEQVFKNMTSEGGVFYQMQEQMANTVAGKISNLKDSITLMFQDIGQSSAGAIHLSLRAMKALVDNWQYVGAAIKTVVAAYAAYQVVATIVAATQGSIAKALAGEKVAVNQLARAWILLKSAKLGAVSLTGWGIATVAIASAAAAVFSFIRARKQSNEEEKEAAQRAEELAQELKIIGDEYMRLDDVLKKISVSFKEAVDSNDVAKQKMQLLELIRLANEEYHMKIVLDVDSMNKDEVKQEAEKLAKEIEDVAIFSELFQKEYERLNIDRFADAFEEIREEFLKGYKTIDYSQYPGEYIYEKVLNKELDDLEKEYEKAAKRRDKLLEKYAGNIQYMSGGDESEYWEASAQMKETEEKINKLRPIVAEMQADLVTLAKKVDATGYDANKVVNAALNRLKEREGYAPEFSEMLEGILKKVYNVDDIDIGSGKRELKQWEKDFNDLIKELSVDLTEIVPENYISELADLGLSEDELAGQFVDLITPDSNATREELIEKMEKLMKEAKAIMDAYLVEGQGVIGFVQNIVAKRQYKVAERALKFLGSVPKPSSSGRGKDKTMDALRDQISLLKEMNDEYTSLLENMSDEAAKLEVIESYRKSLKTLGLTKLGFNIDEMDFTDEATIESLRKLLALPRYKKDKYASEILRELDNLEVTLMVEARIKEREGLAAKVEELFDRQELTKELKGLGLGDIASETLFNFETLTLDELEQELIAMQQMFAETGEKGVELYEEYLDKIRELRVKDQRDSMREYVEYARDSLGEAARIRAEELEKLSKIDEAFAIVSTDGDAEIAFKNKNKQRAKDKARKDRDAALAKLEWEEFRQSETFISLFDDLERASDATLAYAIEKLNNFKDEWSDLPVDQMKEVIELINKAEAAMGKDTNPWERASDARKAIATSEYKTRSDAEKASSDAETKKREYELELEAIDLINEKKSEEKSKDEIRLLLDEKHHKFLEMDGMQLSVMSFFYSILIKQQEQIIDNSQDRIQNEDDLIKAYKDQAETIREISQMTNNLYDSFSELYEVCGGDKDSVLATFSSMGMEMANSVTETLAMQKELDAAREGAEGFSLAMNSAMGVVGWIVMAVQLLSKVIKAIAQIKENKRLEAIEAEVRAIDELTKKYDELGEAIDEAYSTEQLRRLASESERITNKLIERQKENIRLLEDAKHASEVGHEDWQAVQDAKEELKEMQEQQAETIKEILSIATNGVLDSALSLAQEFTDAWYEAFKETGDGLSGLEDNFNEMFLGLAKNQAAMQITGAFAKQWQRELEKYIDEDDTELTKEEARKWAEEVRRTFPQLNDALEGYLGAFSDYMSPEAGGLSALQKGIQGVTEQTAQVIESYLNSIRLTQANNNLELKTQTTLLRNINTTLNEIVNPSSSIAISSRLV